jgi:hypothetical protein
LGLGRLADLAGELDPRYYQHWIQVHKYVWDHPDAEADLMGQLV